MRPFLMTCITLASLGLLVACGDSSKPEAPASAADTAARVDEAGRQIASVKKLPAQVHEDMTVDPCDLLSDEFVRQYMPSAGKAEISRRISEYSVHPLCVVTWRKPDADEIESQRGAAMQDYMQRKMRGEKVKMPDFRTDDEITLTLYEPVFDSSQAAQASFDHGMAVLQKGVTGSHEGVEVTFQSDVFAVDSVGDKATWAAKMRQLSVVSGGRIFYITVNTGADPADELATAVSLAGGVQKLL